MIPAMGRSAVAGRPRRQRVGMLRGHLQKKAGTDGPGFASDTAGVTVLIIGPDESRTDGIIFSGTVQVDGCIEGDIRCNRLVVTRRGRIDGTVTAHSVTIDGTVNGPIDAARIFVGPSAVIKGNLTYKALNVATGASISGFCRDRGRFETAAAGRAVHSGPPPLAFNLAKSACGRHKPIAFSAPPVEECRAAAGSMKAVWEARQRDPGGTPPGQAAMQSIASLAAAYAVSHDIAAGKRRTH